jgi:hypothetical protein
MNKKNMAIQIDKHILNNSKISVKDIIEKCELFLGAKYHQSSDMWIKEVHDFFVLTEEGKMAACSLEYVTDHLDRLNNIINYSDMIAYMDNINSLTTLQASSNIKNISEFEEFNSEEV